MQAYRLEIERLPEQFVTHQSMVNQVRFAGLKVRGNKLKCLANPITNELEVSGLTCAIVDVGGQATTIFGQFPSLSTWLTSECTAAATSMTVRNTTGWASGGTLWLDSEAISYSSKTSTTFAGLTRGMYSTLAQRHYVATAGAVRYPEVTNRPVSLAGARAKLYAYGQNDDPQGDGTLIWQGVVTRHPTMVGAEWRVSIDPITSVLNKTVSADLAEPATPRGIKYDIVNTFLITFFRPDILQQLTIEFPRDSSDRAFFETNQDFCDYLNTRIDSLVEATWSGSEISIHAVCDGDSSWWLEISTDGTIVEILHQNAVIDPLLSPLPYNDSGVPVGDGTTTWAADTVYRYVPIGGPSGAGSVPRGHYGALWGEGLVSPTLLESFPTRRLYLSSPVAVGTLVDTVMITRGSGDRQIEPTLIAYSSSLNYVDTEQNTSGGIFSGTPEYFPFTSANLPEIRFGRTYADSGSLWSAISAIIAAAPDGLNAGATPDLRSSDFDATSWGELDEDWQPRIVRARMYRSFSDVPLLEMIQAELMLAGYWMGVSSTGSLQIARIKNVVTSTAADANVGSIIVDPSGVPTWEPTAYGLINQVVVQRGYNAQTDEYDMGKLVVRDVAGFGRNPQPRAITIAPKSIPSGEAETYAECLEVLTRLFSVMGLAYARVSFSLPISFINTSTIGKTLSVSTQLLPNAYSGTRGVSSLIVTVIGREIDLDNGVISVKGFTALNRGAGYAPQSLITAESNVSGDTWQLTVSSSYFPGVTEADDWFEVGDAVIVRPWDSTATTEVAGSVTAVSANVVTVAFTSSAAAITSGDWFLTYDASGNCQPSQLIYCFLANSDATLDAFDSPLRFS